MYIDATIPGNVIYIKYYCKTTHAKGVDIIVNWNDLETTFQNRLQQINYLVYGLNQIKTYKCPTFKNVMLRHCVLATLSRATHSICCLL